MNATDIYINYSALLFNFRLFTMRWKLILPFITRPQILVSTHHISSLPHLHCSSLVTRTACSHCHNLCCNLNTKLAPVNYRSFVTVSGCKLTSHFTHIWTRGYAKGKDRGRDKKSEKGITCIYLLI